MGKALIPLRKKWFARFCVNGPFHHPPSALIFSCQLFINRAHRLTDIAQRHFLNFAEIWMFHFVENGGYDGTKSSDSDLVSGDNLNYYRTPARPAHRAIWVLRKAVNSSAPGGSFFPRLLI
jgi:hypothetical protein